MRASQAQILTDSVRPGESIYSDRIITGRVLDLGETPQRAMVSIEIGAQTSSSYARAE